MTTSSISSASAEDIADIFLNLICPFLGCLLAAATFSAPIEDLRQALLDQRLGHLNPRPWALMTGNCLGWCAYAYYTKNPFVLASNIPGLVLSLWLNAGAAKLQYKELTAPKGIQGLNHRPATVIHDGTNSLSNDMDEQEASVVLPNEHYFAHHPIPVQQPSQLVFTPQELMWLRIVTFWSVTLVWVGWISPFEGDEAITIGVLVNLNLISFYGAPLQAMSEVVRVGHSNSIHPASMIMTCSNSIFWLLYGIALWDPFIMLPMGLDYFLEYVKLFCASSIQSSNCSKLIHAIIHSHGSQHLQILLWSRPSKFLPYSATPQ